MNVNMNTKENIKLDSYFKKPWFPLTSGTIINISIYLLFKPATPWIIVLIYFITYVIPKAIDSYTTIKLSKINADRQLGRDVIHQNKRNDKQ